MKLYKNQFLFYFFAVILGATACGDDPEEPAPVNDEAVIQQYLADKNLSATKSDEWDVYFIELEAGTGEQVEINSIVEIDYDLSLIDEDSTLLFSDSSFVFVPEVSSVIPGIARGALTMKEGGKSFFLIPSIYAYRNNSGTLPNGVFVPANSVLQSNITVKDIRTADEQQILEEIKIEEYLAQQQLDSNSFYLSDGLFKSVITEGDAQSTSPAEGSTVTIAYEGSLLDGTGFDNSENAQFALTPGGLINGFYNAVLSMKRDEEAIFVMTSDQAYGDAGTTGINPFTPLVFKIKLINY